MKSWWSDPFRLLVWLFFRPSAWRDAIRRIDPDLPATFALADLNMTHWRNRQMLRLLGSGFILLPALMVALLCLGLRTTNHFSELAFAGMGFGVGIGWLLGLAVSAAIGIGVSVAGAAAFALAWRNPGILTMDMALGVHYALILGVCSAVASHLLVNVGGRTASAAAPGQIFRQIGGFLIAIIISTLIFVLVMGTTGNAITSRQSGSLPADSIGLVVTGIPSLLLGVAVGWRTRSPQRGLRSSILLLVAFLLLFGDAGQQFDQTLSRVELMLVITGVIVLVYSSLFVLPFVLVERLAGTWAGAVAGTLGSIALYSLIGRVIRFYAQWENIAVALALIALGLTMHWWRPLLCYPFEAAWNTLLLRADEQRHTTQSSLLRWNAAFWDELQFLPLYGLDDHLVLFCERNPEAGRAALAQISSGAQRWAARAAQIEVDARQLERCATIEDIAEVHWQLASSELSGPASALLHNFSVRSRDVNAALQQISFYNQQITLNRVEDALNALFRDLIRSSEPYARRFAPVVQQWERIITGHIRTLTSVAEARQEIPNPYIVGLPLKGQEELFVGRTEIAARLEELLANARHPPLLLYGQRRMGKTSLLYNLRWMLPSQILPLLVDLQGTIASSTSHADFVSNFAKSLHSSTISQGVALEPLDPESTKNSPFTALDDWLDELEQSLLAHGRTTVLLTLDEFEALDQAFTEGRLSGDQVLGMLRHLFQHRRRFKLLLAGSHTLDEYQRWASYLINAPVLHLSYLRPDEALQLITQPIKEFPLIYSPEASQYVLALTRGHPHLVQLLCREIVRVKNEQAVHLRHNATVEDVEIAVPSALATGTIFFSDIMHNQVTSEGARLLRWLAKQESDKGLSLAVLLNQISAPATLMHTLNLLIRREILEEVDGCYRFQVKLVQRWFADQDDE